MGDFHKALYDISVAMSIEEKKNTPKESKLVLGEYCNMAGLQHYELGQLEEALEYFKMAEKQNSFNGMYHFNVGLAQSKLGYIDQAIDCFEKANTKLNPTENPEFSFQARLNLGLCLRKAGKLEESITKLKLAHNLNPDSSTVLNAIGLSQHERGEFELAIEAYNKAIKNEDNSLYYYNRALT